jgi:uncharacterized protein (TIGR03437 family)
MRPHLVAIFALACVCHAQNPPKFSIQDLGSLPDLPNCTGVALSQSGLVAGYCRGGTGGGILDGASTRGFLWANGKMTDLGAAPKPVVVPTAVNDSGTIIGSFFQGARNNVIFVGPFLYQNGAFQPNAPLATFPVEPQVFVPFGLTNSGLACGTLTRTDTSLTELKGSEAFLFSLSAGGAPSPLALPLGTSSNAVFGISPNGRWAAGGALASGSEISAYLWHDGQPRELPRLTGLPSHFAVSVNDAGVAVGEAFNMDMDVNFDPNAIAHGVIFKGAATIDIPVFSGDRFTLPTSINNSGQVVGFGASSSPSNFFQLAAVVQPAASGYRAVFYTNGVLYDLNRVLVNPEGWRLTFATMINDAGQIVGTGTFHGYQRAFLLTPVAPAKIDSIVGAGLSVPAVKPLSTNGLLTIFGSGFTKSDVRRGVTQADLTGDALPVRLADTCVQAGADRWPLLYVSATQINALAGTMPASDTVPVSVVTDCGLMSESATPAVSVPVAAAAPELLYFVQNQDGHNPVAAVQASTGAYVGPVGLIPGAGFSPAMPNDILTLYAVGLGPTDPPSVAGVLASGAADITAPFTLSVGDLPAQVLYAGLSPTYAGLYQVNFVVPQSSPSGNQPIVLTVNGVPSAAGAYLAIGP